jgi:hypothetical protein
MKHNKTEAKICRYMFRPSSMEQSIYPGRQRRIYIVTYDLIFAAIKNFFTLKSSNYKAIQSVHTDSGDPFKSPVQWVPIAKRPGREVWHTPLSETETKNGCSYTSSPPIPS